MAQVEPKNMYINTGANNGSEKLLTKKKTPRLTSHTLGLPCCCFPTAIIQLHSISFSSYLVKWSQPSHLTSLTKLVLKCGSQQVLRPNISYGLQLNPLTSVSILHVPAFKWFRIQNQNRNIGSISDATVVRYL